MNLIYTGSFECSGVFGFFLNKQEAYDKLIDDFEIANDERPATNEEFDKRNEEEGFPWRLNTFKIRQEFTKEQFKKLQSVLPCEGDLYDVWDNGKKEFEYETIYELYKAFFTENRDFLKEFVGECPEF